MPRSRRLGDRSAETAVEPLPQEARWTIEQLVAEEHELWERESTGAASEDDRRRLQELRVSLDQCWDLLRQRRALREAGLDQDAATARDPNVVESYEQ